VEILKDVIGSLSQRVRGFHGRSDQIKRTATAAPEPEPRARRLFRRTLSASLIGATLASVAPQLGYAQSSACVAGETLTNFSFSAWPAGSTSQTFTAGTAPNQVGLTINVTGTGQSGGTPRLQQRGSFNNSLSIEMDQPNAGATVNVQILWSKPVNKLRYLLLDVDSSDNSQGVGIYQDRMVVTGLNTSAASNPTMVANTPTRFTQNPFNPLNEAIAIAGPNSCAETITGCNITVNHALPVTESNIAFTSGPAYANPTQQWIGINNFSFCVPSVDLELVKSDGNASFTAGSTGTYTFAVTNNGGLATSAVSTVKDILPAGMSFTAPLTPGGANGGLWTCAVSTTTNTNDTATCTRAAGLAAGASNTFTLPVNVAANASGTLTNRAKVFGGGDINKPAETTTGTIASCTTDGVSGGGAASGAGCGIEDTPILSPLLTVTKTNGGTSLVPGQTTSYTVTIANSGSALASGVSWTDTPVSGLTVTAITTGTATGAGSVLGTCTTAGCTGISVAAGGSVTYTVTATVTASTTSAVNRADVGGGGCTAGLPSTPANCTSTDTDVKPLLTVTKTNGGTSLVPGQTTAYTVTIANAGTGLASGVAWTDTPISGLTVNSIVVGTATGAGSVLGTCTTAGCTGISIAAGGSVTYTVNATVTGTTTSAVNRADVGGGGCTAGLPSTPANCTSTDTDVKPLLTVTKSNGGTTVNAGGTTTYTVTITNTGTGLASGVTWNDVAVTGITVTAITTGTATGAGSVLGTCTTAGCTGISVAAGGSVSYTVTATVTAAAGANTTNRANVGGGGCTAANPSTPANCTSDDTDTVVSPALTVTKTNGVSGLVPGQTTTYTVTIANSGAALASGVSWTDTPVSGLTVTSITVGTATGAGSVLGTCTTAGCTGISVAAGGSVTYTVTATVTNTTTSAVNRADVGGGGCTAGLPSTPANCTSTDTDVKPLLTVTKSNGGTTVNAGGTTTYTVTITNTGTGLASGVIWNDVAVTGITVTAITTGTATGAGSVLGTCTTAGCTGISVAAGGSVTYTVTANVTAAAGANTTNRANVGGGGCTAANPSTPANCTSDDTDTVVSPALTVAKTNGVSGLVPGQTTTYTVTISNSGTGLATGVSWTDTPVSGLTVTAITTGTATGAGSVLGTCTTAGCTGISVAAGGSVTYTVTATVTGTTTSAVNRADVGGGGCTAGLPSTPANCTSTDTDVKPLLTVTKSNGGTTVNAGGTTTYTVTITNTGTGLASGVTWNDVAVTGITVTAITTGTATGAGSVLGTCTTAGCTGISVAAGGSVTYTVTATVTAAAGANTTNRANVGGGGCTAANPSTPANCTSDDTDTVVSPALTVTKTNGVSGLVPGQTTTYTVTIANAGTALASGVSWTDTPVSGLTVTAITTGTATGAGSVLGTCTTAGCTGISVAAGGSVTYTVTATVTGTTTSAVNRADVDGGGCTTGSPANCTSTDTDVKPLLTVTKSNGGTALVPGQTTAYTVTITNTGTGIATGVSWTDTPVSGLTVTSITTGTATGAGSVLGTCTTSGCTGISVAAGGQVTYTVNATVTGTTSSAVNRADVGGGGCTAGLPSTPANCTSTDTDVKPLLTVTKSNGGTTVNAGGTTTYTVTITNTGTGLASGVTWNDVAVTGITVTAITTGTATGAGSVLGTCTTAGCTGISVAAGGSVTYTVTATVTAAAGANTTNRANVGGGGCTAANPSTPANCTSDDTDTVVSPALTVTKTNGVSGLVPGQTTTYTVTIANSGTALASGVSWTDTPVSGLTVTAITTGTATGAGSVLGTCTTAGCTGISIAAGGQVTYTVTATVTNTTSSAVNRADVGGGGCTAGLPSTPANCTSTDTDVKPLLTVTKSNGGTTVNAGGTTTYTVTITNTGTGLASGVTWNDVAVTGITVTAITTGTATGAGSVLGTCTTAGCTGISVDAGGSVTYTVTATVTAAAGANTTNRANVGGGGCTAANPSTPANCTSDDTDTVVTTDMISAITNLPIAAGPGASVTGTLTCTNAGSAAATSVTCTVSGATLGTCQVNGTGPAVTQPVASLPAGSNIVCAISGTAPTTGTLIINGNTSASNETNTGNNTSTGSVPVIDAVNDAAVTITSSPSAQAVPGSVLQSDTIGGLAATTSNVAVQPTVTVTGGATTAGWTIDSAGIVTAPASVAAGTYSVSYTICSNPAATPAACDTATKTVIVNPGTPPDLTPNFTFGATAYPNPTTSTPESRFVVMNINEINNVTTSGQVRFNVPLSVGFTYEFDSSLTTVDVGGFPEAVDNGNWEMRLVPVGSPTTMVFTLRNATTTPPAVPALTIPGNGRSRIALKSTPTLAGTKANITVNIVSGSGGETRLDNNVVVLSQSVQR